MQNRAVVEVTRRGDGTLPVRFIEGAYRASQRYPVALVLHDVAPEEVDRVLDPMIAALGVRIPGVIYFEGHDRTKLLGAASDARLVIACSAAFQAELTGWRVAFREAPVSDEGVEDLIYRACSDSWPQNGVAGGLTLTQHLHGAHERSVHSRPIGLLP